MGALGGTLSYKIFYVQGDLPEDWKTQYIERIQKNAFKPLEPDGEEETSDGWVPIERPLQVEFDLYTVLFNHFINLGLRQDKYSVPAGLLKAHVAQAEQEYMAQNGKEKLTKFEQDDIKTMVKRRLKEKQLPRMRVFDMSWDLQRGRVRFWSHSGKVCELFQGYFEDTFGLKVLPGNPYVNGLQAGLSPVQEERLREIESTNFIAGLEG